MLMDMKCIERQNVRGGEDLPRLSVHADASPRGERLNTRKLMVTYFV